MTLPLTPHQRDAIRARVESTVRDVQQIARAHGASTASLPTPSRRALQFLESIHWDGLPTPSSVSDRDASPRLTLTVNFQGLSTYVDRVLARLAQPLPEEAFLKLLQSLQSRNRQIERIIRTRALAPDQIAPKARALRGWIAYFCREENLRLYVAAQQTAGPILHAGMRSQRQKYLEIHFRPLRGIYQFRHNLLGMRLALPSAMVACDADTFQAVADMAFGKSRTARQRVITAMTAEGFQSIRAEIEALGGIHEQTAGAFHDLSVSFDRVNAGYFAGTMARPRLTWSRDFTGRKFGHYDWILDTVMVSSTLDRGDIPAYVVDFIVYHELLHKKHGLAWTNGRGYAHTAEFYAEEKHFAHYHEAEAALAQLARGKRFGPADEN